MRKPIRFDAEAEEELAAAATWYEGQRPGLGDDLLLAVADAVTRIRATPAQHALAPTVPPDLGVRRVLVRRFPYAIPYIELDSEIRILALAHARRRPGYWQHRVRNDDG